MYIYHFDHHINHHTYASFNLNNQSMCIIYIPVYVNVYKNIVAPNQVSTKWVLKPKASQEITGIRIFLWMGGFWHPDSNTSLQSSIWTEWNRGLEILKLKLLPKTGKPRQKPCVASLPPFLRLGDPSVKSPHQKWFFPAHFFKETAPPNTMPSSFVHRLRAFTFWMVHGTEC